MSSIYLNGSESVSSAAVAIQNAAESISRAANTFDEATRRLEVLFGQGYGSNLDRLIEALGRLNEKQQGGQP